MGHDKLRIVVELEPGEPVTGSAGREGDPPVRFEGMLGFLSLFERLRRATPDAPTSPPDAAGQAEKIHEGH